MRVFVTGASGWIGSAVMDELQADGHQVTGLARSDASATALQKKGVQIRRGDLDVLESIRGGAESADAVIHLANKHDWSNPAASNAAERAVVQTISDVLAGSDRPFLFAAGVAGLTQGRPSAETDVSPFHGPDSPRGGAENLAFEFADRGVRVVSLRFAPTVHGTGDHGFIAAIAAIARQRGISGYPADGTNRWAAVHRSDAARMIVLGLAKAASDDGGAGLKLHAVAEEGIASRQIAEAIGRTFDLSATGQSPLAGYLATSPGGLFAVLSIAAETGAGTTFVLAVQVLRIFVMLLVAPGLAVFLAKLRD